jgi:glycosyltransferase involved in cell wall biosynthesis
MPSISISFGAVNRDYFFPSNVEPTELYVFISGDVKARKQPGRILEVVRACPDIQFVLFGRKWHRYILQLQEEFKNVKIAGSTLSDSGFFMRNASCYLSLSTVEGGPYGTIEALSSGTPVVCTGTGWNSEIISQLNGVIVRDDASIAEIRAAIEQAFELKGSATKPSLYHPDFTWENQARVLFKEPINEA